MTVEERARQFAKLIVEGRLTKESAQYFVAQALRDQIEECAKVCEGHAEDHRSAPEDSPVQYAASEAETLTAAIRALAGSTSTTTEERKESER